MPAHSPGGRFTTRCCPSIPQVNAMCVRVLPILESRHELARARRNLERRDPDDAHPLALARALGLPLWSNDRDPARASHNLAAAAADLPATTALLGPRRLRRAASTPRRRAVRPRRQGGQPVPPERRGVRSPSFGLASSHPRSQDPDLLFGPAAGEEAHPHRAGAGGGDEDLDAGPARHLDDAVAVEELS